MRPRYVFPSWYLIFLSLPLSRLITFWFFAFIPSKFSSFCLNQDKTRSASAQRTSHTSRVREWHHRRGGDTNEISWRGAESVARVAPNWESLIGSEKCTLHESKFFPYLDFNQESPTNFCSDIHQCLHRPLHRTLSAAVYKPPSSTLFNHKSQRS